MVDDSKFLILGANGKIGLALRAKYPNARATDAKELDIGDDNSVATFDWTNIVTILNAAAYTDIDGAETPEGRKTAWRVNAMGPANLARVARERDILLVHFTTDYVFDGSQNPHFEGEAYSPLNAYGAAMAAGNIVVKQLSKHCLIRSSWVVGEGPNFVRTMLEKGKKGEAVTAIHDQIGRLTFTSQVAEATNHLLATNAAYGTYNVSNDGDPCSWADVARTIFHEANMDIYVTNTTTAEYYATKPGTALRPLNSTMDLNKIKSAGFKPTNWHDDLKIYIKEELAKV